MYDHQTVVLNLAEGVVHENQPLSRVSTQVNPSHREELLK